MKSDIALLFSSILLLLTSSVDATLPDFKPDSDFPISRCEDTAKYPVFYCLRVSDGKSYFSDPDKPYWWDDALFPCNEEYTALCCEGERWKYITGIPFCVGAVGM
ncbi:hypothetical protein MJO28_000703 [Puccinia striiformis f. sp. tritici]|uniref:Uncharacterized protein n=4 Tax=Puccinia striiformis TaxID=27350 RepID=A0A0L0V260_9BASI|nr:hypothetical protein Pst134EA_000544 [Puccinia striiformis f. sp. tritici]KAI9602055.1 hypothetical protein KEM48_001003 [Puccinia striiformis f. sp. tritici PST-130]KNE93382.1 hypothetical protein PSTG_13204 [Puccinia striiformis f. sp. tritici PST-78]POW07583.1 hypothetical protein PSTT_08124 [Puccinia striiformis]KAH9466683.1 hypothetical protein Pst134EB_001734 [Puccinia striiformis f. sp. tritici]KAH9473471.1 hypothetical protein Pst134EA_000544 [Puccinia striiformis f. sp. tritici]